MKEQDRAARCTALASGNPPPTPTTTSFHRYNNGEIIGSDGSYYVQQGNDLTNLKTGETCHSYNNGDIVCN